MGRLKQEKSSRADPGTLFPILANLKLRTHLSAAIFFLLVGSKNEAREQNKIVSSRAYILEV